MKLTARLKKIASLVDSEKTIADIGTDHGYIPSYLMSRELISQAILTDINKGPLDNARSEITCLGFQDRCQLRLGSGLEVINPGEVDQIIIAGMGGILISEILETGKKTAINAEKLILQPMQAQKELRIYLKKAGYIIESEHLVKEDFRIYEILVARYGNKVVREVNEPINNFEIQEEPSNFLSQNDMENILEDLVYEIPILIFDNPKDLVEAFLDKKIHEYSSILDKIPDLNTEKIKRRKEEIIFKLNAIKKLKKRI